MVTFSFRNVMKNMLRKLSFKFYIITIFCIFICGFYIGKKVLMPYFYEHMINMVVVENKKIAEHIFIHDNIAELKISMNDELQILKNNFKLIKLKYYDKHGIIKASTNREDVGKKNSFDYFDSKVKLGKIHYKVVRKGESSLENEYYNKDIAEIYIPLTHEGMHDGAVEVYYDLTEIQDEFDRIIFRIDSAYFIISFFSLCILYFILYRLSMSDLKQQYFQKEILDLNKSLKKTVKKRTKQLEYKNNELQKLLNHDSLTQVYSRAFLLEMAKRYFELVQRNETTLFCITFDLDHFKKINDTYGHAAGDKVLKEFSLYVQQFMRSSDIFGRVGGEEFMAFVQNVNKEGVNILVEKIRKHVEENAIVYKNSELKITVSIGISTFSNEKILDELIEKADKALYEAKENGRNQVKFYETKKGQ